MVSSGPEEHLVLTSTDLVLLTECWADGTCTWWGCNFDVWPSDTDSVVFHCWPVTQFPSGTLTNLDSTAVDKAVFQHQHCTRSWGYPRVWPFHQRRNQWDVVEGLQSSWCTEWNSWYGSSLISAKEPGCLAGLGQLCFVKPTSRSAVRVVGIQRHMESTYTHTWKSSLFILYFPRILW